MTRAVLFGRADQEIDHAFGIGAAVDIVAEMDDAPVGDGLAVAVLDDRVIHLEQQVEPAVHVADRVDAQVCPAPSRLRNGRRPAIG